jgi:hypothetical protein
MCPSSEKLTMEVWAVICFFGIATVSIIPPSIWKMRLYNDPARQRQSSIAFLDYVWGRTSAPTSSRILTASNILLVYSREDIVNSWNNTSSHEIVDPSSEQMNGNWVSS